MTQMLLPRAIFTHMQAFCNKWSSKKGHNSHNNWQILPYIELDLYFMIIYLCIKYESNTPIFFLKKIWKEKHFLKVEKGHNSHNNG